MVYDHEFRIYGQRLRVKGLGFRVWVLTSASDGLSDFSQVDMLSSGSWVSGGFFRVLGFGYLLSVQGPGIRTLYLTSGTAPDAHHALRAPPSSAE